MKKGVGRFKLIGVVLILVLFSFMIFFYRTPVTGQATQNQPVNQPLAQPANQVIKIPDTPQNTKSLEEICAEKSLSIASQDRMSYMQSCTTYLYKVCFSESACGPFHCIGMKCQ